MIPHATSFRAMQLLQGQLYSPGKFCTRKSRMCLSFHKKTLKYFCPSRENFKAVRNYADNRLLTLSLLKDDADRSQLHEVKGKVAKSSSKVKIFGRLCGQHCLMASANDCGLFSTFTVIHLPFRCWYSSSTMLLFGRSL